jgi:hypothetical protein
MTRAFVAALIVVGMGSAGIAFPAHANLITNGSLTGPVQLSGVPSPWASLSGTPDTNDVSHNVGGIAGASFGVPPQDSPDGGTWVGLGNNLLVSVLQESFGQNVGGLTPGVNYHLSWYAANFGVVFTSSTISFSLLGDNAIQVFLDGVSIATADSLSLDEEWVSQSIVFTATASSHQIRFGIADVVVNSYLSIDGIVLNAVPEPATVALFGFALACFALSRRRMTRRADIARRSRPRGGGFRLRLA